MGSLTIKADRQGLTIIKAIEGKINVLTAVIATEVMGFHECAKIVLGPGDKVIISDNNPAVQITLEKAKSYAEAVGLWEY